MTPILKVTSANGISRLRMHSTGLEEVWEHLEALTCADRTDICVHLGDTLLSEGSWTAALCAAAAARSGQEGRPVIRLKFEKLEPHDAPVSDASRVRDIAGALECEQENEVQNSAMAIAEAAENLAVQDWACISCTFLNPAANLECEMCQTAHPHQQMEAVLPPMSGSGPSQMLGHHIQTADPWQDGVVPTVNGYMCTGPVAFCGERRRIVNGMITGNVTLVDSAVWFVDVMVTGNIQLQGRSILKLARGMITGNVHVGPSAAFENDGMVTGSIEQVPRNQRQTWYGYSTSQHPCRQHIPRAPQSRAIDVGLCQGVMWTGSTFLCSERRHVVRGMISGSLHLVEAQVVLEECTVTGSVSLEGNSHLILQGGVITGSVHVGPDATFTNNGFVTGPIDLQ